MSSTGSSVPCEGVFELTVVRGCKDGPRQQFLLRADTVLRIGSHASNDIVIDAARTSKRHAELYVEQPHDRAGPLQLRVRDMSSKNGTGVRPVPKSQGALPPWEQLKCGSSYSCGECFQLKVPLKSRKQGTQLPERSRTLTLRLVPASGVAETCQIQGVAIAKTQAEPQADAQFEAEAIARAAAEAAAKAKAKAETEAKADENAKAARDKEQAEAKAKIEAEAQARAKAAVEAKTKEEFALAKAKAERMAKLKAEAQAPVAAMALPAGKNEEKKKKKEKKEEKKEKKAHKRATQEAQMKAAFGAAVPVQRQTEVEVASTGIHALRQAQLASPGAKNDVKTKTALTEAALAKHTGVDPEALVEPLRDMSVSPISAPSASRVNKRKKDKQKDAPKEPKAKKQKKSKG